MRLARNYSLPAGRGSVTARVFPENRGLRAAWLEAWRPAAGQAQQERAIIVEDDLELAPQWFAWLRQAWAAYGDRQDLAGVALSRQYLMLKVLYTNKKGNLVFLI